MAIFESCFHRLNTLPNQLDFEVVTPVIQYASFLDLRVWSHYWMMSYHCDILQ
jgi:hypothetical protein